MGFLKYYRLVNALNLDVVAGAVCCSVFFSKMYRQEVHVLALIVLGLTVWSVYIFDHLGDSADSINPASKRRLFYYTHRREMKTTLAVCVCLCGALALFLPRNIFMAGLVMIVPVLIYLLVQRRIWWMKEFVVALFYTAGILIPSAAGLEFGMNFIPVICFACIAFLNLLIFSWYDHEMDKADGHRSIVVAIGKQKTSLLIWLSTGATVALIILSEAGVYSLVFAAMLIAHIGIFIFPGFFGRDDRFRLFGDAVFLLPGLLFLI